MTQHGGIGWQNGTAYVAPELLIVLARRPRQPPNTFDWGPIDPDGQMRLECLLETLEDRPPDTLFDRRNQHAVSHRHQRVAAEAAAGNILYRIV